MNVQSSPTSPVFRWVMLFGVWLLYFSFGLVGQSLAPLVLDIVADLDLSLSSMGRILGAWQLVFLFAAIPLGVVVDRYGLRTVLFVAAMVISLSALFRGLAYDGITLWLAVALFGLGGPLISIGAPKVITRWFDTEERGTAIGIYMTGPALGGIFSLSLTNSVLMPLLDHDWRRVMFLIAFIGLLAGVVWLVINLSTRSFPPEQESARPPGATIGQLVTLLREPLVLLIMMIGIAIFIFLHGLSSWLPAILVDKGMSAVAAGHWASLPSVVGIAASLLVPRFAIKGRRVWLLATLASLALLSTLGLLVGEGPLLIAGLICQGIARGAMMTIAILILIESPAVSTAQVGMAMGLFFTFAEIGGVAGPAGIGLIADLGQGFDAALWALASTCGVLVLLALSIRRFSG